MTAPAGSDVIDHVIGATGELRVRLHAGELELRGAEGDAVRIRDLDGGDLAERFSVDTADDRLSIKPRDRFLLDFGLGIAGFGRDTRLEIQVPLGARLAVDTASADIRASGLRGEQRYRTASGSIDLVAAEGDIGVDAVSGDIDVRLAGEAALSGRAVSGDVSVEGGVLRALTITTTSGDARIESPLRGPGPFGVQTVSGDISVFAPLGLRVEANTVTGEVSAPGGERSEPTRGRHVLTVGDGGVPFTFKSISGDLRVTAGSGTGRAAAGDVPPEREPESDPRAAERLSILRDLETGAIDIEAASARLADLEDAG